jgi:hypothetical protein
VGTQIASSLTSYSTTTAVNTLIANSLTNYVTTSSLAGKNYITSGSISVTSGVSTGTGFMSYNSSTGVISYLAGNLSPYTTTATVNTLIANSLTNYTTSTLVNGSNILSVNSDGTMTLPGNQINGGGTAIGLYSTNAGGSALSYHAGGGVGLPFQSNVVANSNGITLTTIEGVVPYLSSKTWTFDWNGNLTFPDSTVQSTAWTATILTNYVTTSSLAGKNYITSGSISVTSGVSTGTGFMSYNSSTGVISYLAGNLSPYTTTATVNTLIANSLTNYSTTVGVKTLIANSLSNYTTPTLVNGSYSLTLNSDGTMTLPLGVINGGTVQTYLSSTNSTGSGLVWRTTTPATGQAYQNQIYAGSAGLTITTFVGTPTSLTSSQWVFGSTSGALTFPDTTQQTSAWTGVAAAGSLSGTTLKSTVTASNLTSVGTLAGLNVTTTNGSSGSLVVIDTGINGGNIRLVGNGSTTPSKTIRAYSGNFQILNDAYTATIFQVSDAGMISTGGASAATSNIPTSNAISLNGNGYISDDGNFHITSGSGSIWINPVDSSAVRIGTQYNSGSGAGLVVQGGITSNTTDPSQGTYFPKVQTNWNVNQPSLAMDNLNVRLRNTGGNSLIIEASAVSGSFTAYTSLTENIAGNPIRGTTNSGGITFTAGSWTSVNAYYELTAGGDTTVMTLADTTNGRIYRVTCIHTNGATNGSIFIERMV